ncbi:MAG: sodium-dependent transporter [Marinoscillum sp.]
MQRENWGSKFGFIMATAGSAVGLGNIWRFPYVTGENGGGAFVFIYLLAVIFVGTPLLFNEMALGRWTSKSPIGAFKKTGSNNFWMLGAILSIAVSFFVMSYYGVISGWILGYIYSSVRGSSLDFDSFIADPTLSIPLFAAFMFITALIVRRGISKGIEKASKVLMPLLFVLVLLVIIRSLTLDGAMEGVRYYLTPDFSKINQSVVLSAIGQAFFSMAVGWGIIITYGSYLPKGENIISAGLWVAVADSAVALMGGLMIFPAVFAFGKDPDQGTTLVFQILPEIFESIPFGGNLLAIAFYLLLAIAALTSAISIVEVPVAYLVDERKIKRENATWMVTAALILVGLPSALASGGNTSLTDMSLTLSGSTYTGFLNIMDYLFGNLVIILSSLMVCLYGGWVYKTSSLVEELANGATWFIRPIVGGIRPADIWVFFIKFICPALILMVLVDALF